MDIHEKIEALTLQLAALVKRQQLLTEDVLKLTEELQRLKASASSPATVQPDKPVVHDKVIEFKEVITPPSSKKIAEQITFNPSADKSKAGAKSLTRSTFEEFVGGNLASKIGILVTIVGIFIGAKYAIEHNMIKPTLRIISGYICGLILIGIALRLKNKYVNYSSVLMGGGMSVMYFITYIAYSFYGLLPQTLAFALMLILTIVTVYTALIYNRTIIALLGLVGAYAIPFLLSDNSGRYVVLFTYITIINVGILALSFWKYWKSLFHTAFIITWLVYLAWFLFQYDEARHFKLAFIFLSVFFLIFYITFLAYKLIKKERYGIWDVVILLSNTFIFYGIGYSIINQNSVGNSLGVFTVINAVIHFVVCMVIRRLQLVDKELYYLVLGLAIVFLTIAIPVQFDGNWVTLIWAAEAVLVFIIGRTRHAGAYEKLGVGLILLSFLSLLEDWSGYTGATPIINITFATGLFVLASYGGIIHFSRKRKYKPAVEDKSLYGQFYQFVLPALFLVTAFFLFQLEIHGWFMQTGKKMTLAARGSSPFATELKAFEICCTLVYSMIFAGTIVFINKQWIKNKLLADVCLIGIVLIMAAFLLRGFPVLQVLATANKAPESYFGIWNVLMRYIIIVASLLLLKLGHQTITVFNESLFVKKSYIIISHVVILSVISFEYLQRMGGFDHQYKLGLSIIWGLYGLFLIVRGIWKKKKYLRLAGFFLFTITLIKLFVYDLSEAGTITKTISFISLGAFLLLVSYLYNRYKVIILAGDKE